MLLRRSGTFGLQYDCVCRIVSLIALRLSYLLAQIQEQIPGLSHDFEVCTANRKRQIDLHRTTEP